MCQVTGPVNFVASANHSQTSSAGSVYFIMRDISTVHPLFELGINLGLKLGHVEAIDLFAAGKG